jgi:predicted ABC-type ATPase
VNAKPPPSLSSLLGLLSEDRTKPLAIVLAGHNGSGKSTLWSDKLGPMLQVPLINADNLTASILPAERPLPLWAQKLRNNDERWARLSQEGVRAFRSLVMGERLPFAFETVFSHYLEHDDGRVETKCDDIVAMQQNGYFVVLVFVGLVHVNVSITRVAQRVVQGGHDVPIKKLVQRFPRTRKAIAMASQVADATLMFDNSLNELKGFSLARVQRRAEVLFDLRAPHFKVNRNIRSVARVWLDAMFPEQADRAFSQ